MLIKDDVLRQVTARTLRVKEEDLTPEVMLELTHLEAPDYEIKKPGRTGICRKSRCTQCF